METASVCANPSKPSREVRLVPPDKVRQHLARTLPKPSDLAFEVMFAVRADVQALDNILTRWLEDDGLTPGRMQVLVVLWAHDGPIPQRDIVRLLKVTRPTISGLIDALRAEGHVTTAQDAADKRQVLVKLTPSGRSMIARLAQQTGTRLRAAFGALSDAELGTLTDLLRRLVKC